MCCSFPLIREPYGVPDCMPLVCLCSSGHQSPSDRLQVLLEKSGSTASRKTEDKLYAAAIPARSEAASLKGSIYNPKHVISDQWEGRKNSRKCANLKQDFIELTSLWCLVVSIYYL